MRQPLPERFCNLDRLLAGMEREGLDAVVIRMRPNVFYLSGFMPSSNTSNHESDNYAAVVIPRRAPEAAAFVVGEFDVAYFLTQPTWIRNFRPYRTLISGFRESAQMTGRAALERYVPADLASDEWLDRVSAQYSEDLQSGVARALRDLGVDAGAVGFDVPSFGVAIAERTRVDQREAYELMKWVRQVKTPAELDLMRRATAVNQQAIASTIATWQPGMSWRELAHQYDVEATKLGGFVRDPGGIVIANPVGKSPAFYMESPVEDFTLESGMHIMFDCHGTVDHYCWDGGKTWVVGGETNPEALRIAEATAATMREVEQASKPGVRVSELEALARHVFARSGCTAGEADRAYIFFHGLGLTHIDMALSNSQLDWTLEEGMVFAAHLQVPGDDRTRNWLEQIVHVRHEGGEPLFTWDYGLIR